MSERDFGKYIEKLSDTQKPNVPSIRTELLNKTGLNLSNIPDDEFVQAQNRDNSDLKTILV